jgi:hypothetical protein
MGLGSGIRKKPIPPPPGSRIQGVKKVPDPGSGSATLLFSVFVGHFCPPGSGYGSRDSMNSDPAPQDPQH